MRNDLIFINVYEKRSLKSKISTQLLYGDTFKKIKKYGAWIKIKNDVDGYKGYIKNKNFPQNCKNTHKVFKLSSNLYSKPNIKYKINKKLSFGSKIKVLEKKGNFFRFDNVWIQKKNLKKIDFRTKNIFKYAVKFLGTKYKWGGKNFKGIDCSALIQLFFNFNNKFCPRDTKDQIKYFKKKINLQKAKKNDLIFWKGHVALVMSKQKLMHAYGPLKKTVLMPINQTISRIYKTANLKVTGVRRVC